MELYTYLAALFGVHMFNSCGKSGADGMFLPPGDGWRI